MRVTSQNTASLLTRIHEFLSRQPVATKHGDIKVELERLGAVIKQLDAIAVEGESRRRAAVAATGKIRALTREGKLEHMRVIAQKARIVFPKGSKVRDSLQIPKGLERPEAVIDAMRGMADAASAYKDEFVKGGLTTDFIERMTAVADALREAINARAVELSRRSGASTGTQNVADEGRQAVRCLNYMVSPRLKDTPALLAEWRSLLRQGRVRLGTKDQGDGGSDGSTTPSPTPSPTPTPAPTPAPADPQSGSGAGASSGTPLPAAA